MKQKRSKFKKQNNEKGQHEIGERLKLNLSESISAALVAMSSTFQPSLGKFIYQLQTNLFGVKATLDLSSYQRSCKLQL